MRRASRSFLKGALAACALAFAPAAIAQAPQEWKPETFELANGMRAVVLPDHRAPVVTHMIWYRVGASDEVKGKSGLAHFLEHLMFKATDKIAAGEYSKIVARNGGQDNAGTSNDFTNYHFRIAKDRLPQMMEMEADRLVNLKLAEAEVVSELKVVQEERRQNVDSNPGSVLEEKVMAAMFPGHPYSIPVIGHMDEVAKLTQADAVDWYKTWYGPENAILVVAGDITAAELKPLAEKIYGPVARRGDLKVRKWPEIKPIAKSLALSHSDPKVRQPSWSRNWIGGPVGGPDSEALQVGLEVLGGGRTSRLYRELVEKNIAVNSYAYNMEMEAGGSITLAVSPNLGVSLDEAKTAMLVVADRFLKEGPTPEELTRAKKRMAASEIFARDNQVGMANWYGSLLVTGQPIERIEGWGARIQAVTREQVVAALNKYMTGVNHIDATLLPGKT
ncbi:MAG: pitrilysin family protein [Hyphomonadaceae bacterium]|nr:pitrilysin family protein [Hyphomonadaceae bacterium]